MSYTVTMYSIECIEWTKKQGVIPYSSEVKKTYKLPKWMKPRKRR